LTLLLDDSSSMKAMDDSLMKMRCSRTCTLESLNQKNAQHVGNAEQDRTEMSKRHIILGAQKDSSSVFTRFSTNSSLANSSQLQQ